MVHTRPPGVEGNVADLCARLGYPKGRATNGRTHHWFKRQPSVYWQRWEDKGHVLNWEFPDDPNVAMLAQEFSEANGLAFWPANGETGLVWPADKEIIIKGIADLMRLQKFYQLKNYPDGRENGIGGLGKKAAAAADKSPVRASVAYVGYEEDSAEDEVVSPSKFHVHGTSTRPKAIPGWNGFSEPDQPPFVPQEHRFYDSRLARSYITDILTPKKESYNCGLSLDLLEKDAKWPTTERRFVQRYIHFYDIYTKTLHGGDQSKIVKLLRALRRGNKLANLSPKQFEEFRLATMRLIVEVTEECMKNGLLEELSNGSIQKAPEFSALWDSFQPLKPGKSPSSSIASGTDVPPLSANAVAGEKRNAIQAFDDVEAPAPPNKHPSSGRVHRERLNHDAQSIKVQGTIPIPIPGSISAKILPKPVASIASISPLPAGHAIEVGKKSSTGPDHEQNRKRGSSNSVSETSGLATLAGFVSGIKSEALSKPPKERVGNTTLTSGVSAKGTAKSQPDTSANASAALATPKNKDGEVRKDDTPPVSTQHHRASKTPSSRTRVSPASNGDQPLSEGATSSNTALQVSETPVHPRPPTMARRGGGAPSSGDRRISTSESPNMEQLVQRHQASTPTFVAPAAVPAGLHNRTMSSLISLIIQDHSYERPAFTQPIRLQALNNDPNAITMANCSIEGFFYWYHAASHIASPLASLRKLIFRFPPKTEPPQAPWTVTAGDEELFEGIKEIINEAATSTLEAIPDLKNFYIKVEAVVEK